MTRPAVDNVRQPGSCDTRTTGFQDTEAALVQAAFTGRVVIFIVDDSFRLIGRLGGLDGGSPWDGCVPGDQFDLEGGTAIQDRPALRALVAAAHNAGERDFTTAIRFHGYNQVTPLNRLRIEQRGDGGSPRTFVIQLERLRPEDEDVALSRAFDRMVLALSRTPVRDLANEITRQLETFCQRSLTDEVELEIRALTGRGVRWTWSRTHGARQIDLVRRAFSSHIAVPPPERATPRIWVHGVDSTESPMNNSCPTVFTMTETVEHGLSTSLKVGFPFVVGAEMHPSVNKRMLWLFHAMQQGLLRYGTEKIAMGERHRAELIFKQVSDFVLVWNRQGQLMFANPSFSGTLGIDPLRIPEVTLHDFLPEAGGILDRASKLDDGASGLPEAWDLTFGNTTRRLRAVTTNFCHDEYISGYLTTAQDVTDHLAEIDRAARRSALSAAIASVSSRFVNATTASTAANIRRALTDLASICPVDRILVWQIDGTGRLRASTEYAAPGTQPLGSTVPVLDSESVTELLGPALHGQPELFVDIGPEPRTFLDYVQANSNRELGAILVVGLRSEAGPIGLLSLSAERRDDGTIPGLAALRSEDTRQTLQTVGELFSSVINRAAAQEALTFSASHDALTGLANRRLLLDRAERMLATAHRRSNGIGLLFLDLDDFKTINDTLGHDAGDELLKDVGDRLRRLAVGSTVVARLGGDEFVLLIESPEPERAVSRLASQISNELSTLFSIRGRQIAVRASIGAATVSPGSTMSVMPGDLVRRADMAMYRAKEHSGNSFELFSDWLEDQAQRRFNMHEELREAIATDQLELWFQPQIDLARDTVVGCEALVRWRHPTKGMILPTEFISVAEQAGLISDLGDWVFRRATLALQRLIALQLVGADFTIAVNVSPMQLIDDGLVGRFTDIAAEAGVPTKQLKIELTESTLADRDRVIPNLIALRAQGFSTSIDDFGTGFSSLSYLRDLPLDELKVDRTFIRSLAEDRRDLDMVWALVEMAHSLGLTVVAEGVETETQRMLLENMGCNVGQGWLFAKAMPLSDLISQLRDGSGRFAPASILD